MPFQEEEVTGAQVLQQARCEKFAKKAAETIRSSENCLFSMLPHEELSRLAGEWYEACAQAMLRGNYAPIDIWIRLQSHKAAEQGFEPSDLLQLLLICRRSAIENEGWNEDIFSAVDDVTQEVFGSIYANTPWYKSLNLGTDIDATPGPTPGATSEPTVGATNQIEANAQTAEVEEWLSERRRYARNRLRFPIRVRSSRSRGQVEEIIKTHSVSRGGLYFMTNEEYRMEQVLKICFPYWNEHGGINGEYAAKVVRVDLQQDRTWGIGVDFEESLGRRAD